MRRSLGFAWLIVAGVWLACSSSSSPDVEVDVAGAEPGAAGTSGSADGFMLGEEDLPGTEGDVDGQPPACLGETRQAEIIGLDIYVMLDVSASMLEALPQSATTKWDAVRSSLQSFVQDPATADIGIG